MEELNDFIKLQKLRGADDLNIYEIEKYMRYAQPFTVIILVLLGSLNLKVLHLKNYIMRVLVYV